MKSEGKRILVTIGFDIGQSSVEVVGPFGRVDLPGVMVARVGIDSMLNRDEPPRLYLEIDATCVDVVGQPHRGDVSIERYVEMLKASSEKLSETSARPANPAPFDIHFELMQNIDRVELEKAMRKTFDEFVAKSNT